MVVFLQVEEEEEQEKEIFSPLQENLIKLMLARIFHKLVDHLIAAESYSQAELLCENILEIVDEIQDGSSDLLRFRCVCVCVCVCVDVCNACMHVNFCARNLE